jgi:hypothetical protein
VEKKYGINLIEYSNDISDTVNVDELDEYKQNLVIFDDMVVERNLKAAEELFIRGRKKNASIVFISQSYFSIPKNIRLQCDYFVITKMGNKKELIEIAKDHTTDIDNDKFKEIYKAATGEPYSVLVIDLKYRKNFTMAWSDN